MSTLKGNFLFLYFTFLFIPKLNAQGPALNFDFEASPPSTITVSNQIAGWTITHGNWSSTVNTCNQINCCALPPNGSELIDAPNGLIDPLAGPYYPIYSVFGETDGDANGTLINSHLNMTLKGNKFLRLNKSINGSGGNQIESLTRAFVVTNTLNVLDVAYMILTLGAHNCCESPGFRMTISTSTCQVALNSTCPNLLTSPSFYAAGSNTISTNLTSKLYSKWQVKRFDLGAFIGQTVTLTINASGCLFNGHYGYAYVDTRLSTGMFTVYGVSVPGGTVNVPPCKKDSLVVYGPPFYKTYQWSGPSGFYSTNQNIIPPVSGIYTLQLDMASPCDAATKTISINFIPPPIIHSSVFAICPTATAILTASGSVNYTWTHNGTNSASVAVSPSQNTTYSVICQDTNGCIIPAYYHLTMLSPPSLTIYSTPNICVGDSIKISALGADTYSWQGSNGYVGNLAKVFTKSGLTPELITFSVIGTAINSCTAASTYSIKSHKLPQAFMDITPSQTVCLNTELNLSGLGGKHYEWRGPYNYFDSKQNTSFIPKSLNQAGEYTLCAIDSNGCRGYSMKTIVLNDLPYGHLDGNLIGCAPFFAQLKFTEIGLTKSKLQHSEWKIENTRYTQNNFKHWFASPGEYLVEGRMIDSNTCVNTHTFYIKAYPKPQADFYFSPLKPVEGIDEVIFTNASVGDDQNKWNWFINDAYLPSRQEGKTKFETENFSYKFDNSGLYTIAMVVTNKWNCADTAVRSIQVETDFGMYIPNAFTPNNDGLNDEFKPVIRSTSKYNLKIFDRWGHLIFESTEIEKGWDGTNRGGVNSKSEVYAWRIEVTTLQGENKLLSGHVTLLR